MLVYIVGADGMKPNSTIFLKVKDNSVFEIN